ncbi:MAG: outer membrane lipoprotein carrier protein LolA [Bacteroidota bacterium]
MNTRFRPVPTLLLAAILLLTGWSVQQTVHAQSADDLIQRMQQRYPSTSTFQIDFEQTLTSDFTDESITLEGQALLSGDRFAITLPNQRIISDGTTLWLHDLSTQQVLVNDVATQEGLSLNAMLIDFDRHYRVTAVESFVEEGVLYHAMDVLPKADDGVFAEAILWLRDRDNNVTRIEAVDYSDNRTTFVLTTTRFAMRTPPNAFTYTPPSDVEVVDLRN